MAEHHREFEKLLSEAPMAQDADTVTLVGSLARTKDPACFVLRTADGRSTTLEVAAVKSVKPIAGAIGQTLVELVLDAKRVPENLRNQTPRADYKAVTDYTAVAADYHFGPFGTGVIYDAGGTHSPPKEVIEISAGYPGIGPSPEMFAAYGSYGTRTYLTGSEWTTDHHIVQKPTYDGAAAAAPFAAAMPHQADPATRAFLASAVSGPRTYLTGYVWTADHHLVQKAFSDPSS